MRTSDLPTLLAVSGLHRSSVGIRAIRPTDARALQRFYAALSPDCRRARFLSVGSAVSEAHSTSFCTTDHDRREGFVAIVDDSPRRPARIVGHLCLEPDGADAAEMAIAVADDFQHQGIGRRLLAAGVVWARQRRIPRLTATMFAGNAPIYRLLMGLGLQAHTRCVGPGVAEITIELVAENAAA